LALLTAAGGAAGAALLLSTPAGVFGRVVPFLLVFASLALLLQPRVSAWQENHLVPGSRFMLPCGLLAVSAYGGYFGAGSGVMVLALLLLTVDRHLARANALKNMLLGVRTRPLDGARSTGRNRARGPTVDRPQLVGGPVLATKSAGRAVEEFDLCSNASLTGDEEDAKLQPVCGGMMNLCSTDSPIGRGLDHSRVN
jgi:hypothetical protein